MKVSLHIVEARRQRLAEYLQQHAYASLHDVCVRFKTSPATARRDLAALAAQKQIVRTYGGALTEYHQRFASFHERESRQVSAKRRIAAAARQLIEPGSTCFLDFGTTAYALAAELLRRPLTDLQIVTNSLPVAELLAAAPAMKICLLGGEILPRQAALLGGTARKAVRFYSIDQAFFSAEAADAAGVWNSQTELVNFQQTVLAHASRNVLCLDASKLGRTAPAFLAAWTDFDLLITNQSSSARRTAFSSCEHLLV